MKNLSLQITYRKGKPFAAYVYLPHQPANRSVRCEELRPGLVVDFDADGNPLGIEVISPTVTSIDELQQVFEELGLEQPDPNDLQPLLAA
ncbi:MAG: DUF2283 domain-containing protein [Gemmatimonadota bacterium]